MIDYTTKVIRVNMPKNLFFIKIDGIEICCNGSASIANQCLKEDLCIELIGLYINDVFMVINAARN